MEIKNIYNKISKQYHQESTDGFYHAYVEMPAVKKMFAGNNFAGKKILDIGCGPGRYSRWALNQGAKVYGIDPSEKFLKIAQDENPQGNFILGTANKLPFKNSTFEYIVSGLAVEHEKNLKHAFQEVYRTLKKNGLFVFSGINSLMAITKKVEENCYTFDRYFTENKRLLRLPTFGVNLPFYHRTLETIIKLALGTGFIIEDYSDAKPIKISQKKFPEKYLKNINRPFCFVLKLRKR